MYANPPSIFDDPLTQEAARMTSPCAWPKQEERDRDLLGKVRSPVVQSFPKRIGRARSNVTHAN